MRVLIHPDPLRLEQELVRLVDAAHPSNGVGRTIVVVPTRRLARHVIRRLGERRPAWLGVEVLDLDELAARILGSCGATAPRPVRDRVRDELVRRAAGSERGTAWGRFVQSRPRAISRLRRTFDDLRMAGIDAPALAREGGPDAGDTARLYGRYERALADADGAGDRADSIRAAVEHAEDWVRGAGAVFLHGAYELVGLQLALMRAIDRECPVTALVPCSLDSQAYVYSSEFVTTFLADARGGPPERLDDGDAERYRRRSALEALFDEPRRPERPVPVSVGFRHTQGPRAEVECAALAALEAIDDGCRPHDIAIVARTLEPYAASIESVFAELDLPFVSSVEGPLRRRPFVHDVLLLFRVLDEDFPRRPTVELLRSPRVNWAALLDEPQPPSADRADDWSRRARILGGLGEWRDELPAWVAAADRRGAGDEDVARRIARAIERLSTRAPHSQPPAALADSMKSLIDELFTEPSTEAGLAVKAALIDVLSDFAELETRAGRDTPVSFSRARSWVEEAVDVARFEPSTGDRGVRVLDMAQLRGMTFRRVMLLGLNSGVFPRKRVDDPVLPDALRESLQRRLGLPLPPSSGTSREERLLLALTVGAATERIEASWQRAEETGRARAASLVLRELGRLAFDEPRPPGVEDAEHVPSHPTHALLHAVDTHGLLPPRDGMLLSALRCDDRSGHGRLAARYPDLALRLEMVSATQSFRFGDTRYDARIGSLDTSESLSVTSFERLGRCPLQFFFRDVLKVRELDSAADPLRVDARTTGTTAHDRLERIYRTLVAEGLLESDDPEPAIRRAHDLLADARHQALGDDGRRMRARVPILADHHEEAWHDALCAFVAWDIPRIAAAGAKIVGLERTARGAIDLGDAPDVAVHGRFDRLLRLPDESAWIGDYKTSGNLDSKTNLTETLKGQQLQVALYRELGGASSRVELLAVGPQWDEPRAAESRESNDDQRASVRDTLHVLVELMRSGSFPFRPNPGCSWCAYAPACRRTHPPSVEREANSAEGRALKRLGLKNTRNLDGS